MTKANGTRPSRHAAIGATYAIKSRDEAGMAHKHAASMTAGAELENLLSVRIVQLSEIIQRAASQVYEPQFGIKNAELRILILLGREKQLAVNELSRRTRVDKGWISRSLDAMVQRGIVARTQHASDSRVSLISLTENGRALLEQITPIAITRNDRLLDGFDQADVSRLLDTLLERAEAMLQSAPRQHNPTRYDGGHNV